jgi:molecular chaperone DnaK
MTQSLSAPAGDSGEPEPVSLRFRFDSETVEQFAERYASDVSRGGIFVHSRQPFAVGTQLRLDLQLLDGTPLIVGEGTVFWTREPDPAKPSTVPGMGIRFSKLSGQSQQVIEHVLSQRTGRERSGLFPSATPAVIDDNNSGRAPNPKSKLPFNIFPGRPSNTGSMPAAKVNDGRELLATAGREEATPLVGVSAATLADARPGLDEAASSKTPPPAAPTAEITSPAATQSGVHKRPPLSLIKPGAAAGPGKDGEKAATETSGLHRRLTPSGKPPSGAHRASTGANIIASPPLTSSQEARLPSGSTPPAPVQGEPALGASQSSAVPRPGDASGPMTASRPSPAPSSSSPSSAITPVPTLRPPMTKKLVIGAAALLGVGLSIFALTRHSAPTISPEVKPLVRATAPATSASSEPATTTGALPSAPTPTGSEPAATATAEGSNAPALEPEASGSTASKGSSSSSRGNDRRGAKGKPAAPAHRGPEPAVAARTSPPTDRPAVVEAPTHAEAPIPTPPPTLPPAPVAVARPEPAAPKAITATVPPPVATIAHKLRLTSIPSEAEVELDGKVVGKTPLFGIEIDVSRPHGLVVRKDGFAPFKQTVSSGSEWSVRSSENSATLRISALLKKL